MLWHVKSEASGHNCAALREGTLHEATEMRVYYQNLAVAHKSTPRQYTGWQDTYTLITSVGHPLHLWCSVHAHYIASRMRYKAHKGKNSNFFTKLKLTEIRGLSPRAIYTDRAIAACRRSYCQILRIEGVAWSAQRIPTDVFWASEKIW
jgi:hypothetical protein